MTTTHQDLIARIRARAEIHRTMPIPSACDKITALELAEVAAALEAASQPPGAVEREALLELLRQARPHVEHGAKRFYDGVGGYVQRDEANALLNQIDRAALSAPSPAQAPVVQGEAPKPLSCTDAIAGWHACTDAHERVTAFEWFSAGILFAERAHGIAARAEQPIKPPPPPAA